MALGAERRRILTRVLRQGMELAVAGIVLGLVGALALAMTAMAAVIPAMRATRVDPVVALRDE